jgi:hypothetical protein
VLFHLEHALQDASVAKNGERRTISRQMLYVEMNAEGQARHLDYAPYLDYRPLQADEPGADVLMGRTESAWITRDLEQKALAHAIARSAFYRCFLPVAAFFSPGGRSVLTACYARATRICAARLSIFIAGPGPRRRPPGVRGPGCCTRCAFFCACCGDIICLWVYHKCNNY